MNTSAASSSDGSYRQGMTVLPGKAVTLRPATAPDVAELAAIRATPQVRQRWGGADDLTAEVPDDLAMYRHASIDLQYERSPDGTWHDGLLMELLADELID
jgi:RimJ/RimL family protein N-acetyltransferase